MVPLQIEQNAADKWLRCDTNGKCKPTLTCNNNRGPTVLKCVLESNSKQCVFACGVYVCVCVCDQLFQKMMHCTMCNECSAHLPFQSLYTLSILLCKMSYYYCYLTIQTLLSEYYFSVLKPVRTHKHKPTNGKRQHNTPEHTFYILRFVLTGKKIADRATLNKEKVKYAIWIWFAAATAAACLYFILFFARLFSSFGEQ